MITDLEDLYSITNLLDFAGQQTQRGLAFAWRQSRTRKRSRCQGSGGGLGTDTALVFWDMGNCLMLSHAVREIRLKSNIFVLDKVGTIPFPRRPPATLSTWRLPHHNTVGSPT